MLQQTQQLPPEKVFVGLADQGELELKQERCDERRQAASEWFKRWLEVIGRVGPVEGVR